MKEADVRRGLRWRVGVAIIYVVALGMWAADRMRKLGARLRALLREIGGDEARTREHKEARRG